MIAYGCLTSWRRIVPLGLFAALNFAHAGNAVGEDSTPPVLSWKMNLDGATPEQVSQIWKLETTGGADSAGKDSLDLVDGTALGVSKALAINFKRGKKSEASTTSPPMTSGWAKLSLPLLVQSRDGDYKFKLDFTSSAPEAKKLASISVEQDSWSKKPMFHACSSDIPYKVKICSCDADAPYKLEMWLPTKTNPDSKAFLVIRNALDGDLKGQADFPMLPADAASVALGGRLVVTAMPGSKDFSLLLGGLSMERTDRRLDSYCGHDKPEFHGETSKPNFNVYSLGERVPLTFTGSGLDSDTPIDMKLRIVDEEFRPVEEKTLRVAPKDGRFTLVIDAPNAKMGYYRVFAELPGGVSLPEQGSRGEYVEYAIVRNPAERVLYPMSKTRFGLMGGFNGNLNPLPYLGARWVVHGPSWGGMEPDRPGQYAEKRAADRKAGRTGPPEMPNATRGWEWCVVDKNGKREGWKTFQLMALYNSVPNWAADPKTRDGWNAAILPEAESAWAAYCHEVAKAACEDFPDAEEHVYQITWEPNWFHGSAEQFLAIYKIAYRELHAIDAKALVIGPTQSSVGPSSQVDAWFANGFGDFIDAYSIHPYVRMPPEASNYPEAIRELKKYLKGKTGRDLPIFGTEQGVQSYNEMGEELPQARHVVRANLISLGEGMRLNTAFYIHDGKPIHHGIGRKVAELGYGLFRTLREDGGYGTNLTSPKPVVPAYSAMTYLLDGSTPVGGAVNWFGLDVTGYVFERGGELTLAIWDYGKSETTVALRIGDAKVKVFDWMGNELPIQPKDGLLPLKLTGSPVYVTKLPQAIWGKGAKQPLALDTLSMTVQPGEEFQLRGSIADTLGGDSARYSVYASATGLDFGGKQVVTIGRDGLATFALNAAAPKDASFGKRAATVVVDDASGKRYASASVMVDVEPAMAIRAILPAKLGGTDARAADALTVIASETQGRKRTAKIKVAFPKLQRIFETQSEIKPYEDCQFVLPVPNFMELFKPAERYDATVSIETDSGVLGEADIPFGHLRLPKIPDGKKVDWTKCPTVERELSATGGVGRLRLAWSRKELLLKCELPANDLTRRCSLVVDVNADPAKVAKFTGNAFADSKLNPRLASIAIDIDGNSVVVRRTLSSNQSVSPLGLMNQGHFCYKKLYDVSVKRADGVMTIEAALPWAEFCAWDAGVVGALRGVSVNVLSSPEHEATRKLFSFFDGIDLSTSKNTLCSMLLDATPHDGQPRQ